MYLKDDDLLLFQLEIAVVPDIPFLYPILESSHSISYLKFLSL